MSNKPGSDIDLGLAAIPMTQSPELFKELTDVYKALRILQMELSSAKARIKTLEDYNTSHP